MKNIMLDLETMSVAPTASIVALGAVEFSLEAGVGRTFYEIINLQSCIDRGLLVDGNTVMWWLNCSKKARKEISRERKKSLTVVLHAFKDWLPNGNLQIWGNPVNFDNTILMNAYRSIGDLKPWSHGSNRCFRTIKYSFPSLEVSSKLPHIAIDDAEIQAGYLMDLVKKYKLEHVL